MTYEEAVKLAFIDELREIFAVRGEPLPDLEKFAFDQRLHELVKEAKFLRAIRSVLPQSGTQRFLQTATAEGLGGVAGAALKQSRPSARLQQWGRTMRQTPVQRVREAARAATDPTEKAMLKLRPGEARGITEATKAMGGTSVGKRMLGSAAEHAGEHMGHAGLLKSVGAHAGIPMAGALEGLVAQTGRELKSVGTGLRARAAGQMTGGAAASRTAGRALSGAGQAAARGAHMVGEAGELAAMVGAGAPALTGVVGGAIPGVSALAQKGGFLGSMGQKYLGGRVLGAGDVALKKGLQMVGV